MQIKFQSIIEQIISDPCIILFIVLLIISLLSKSRKMTYFNFNKIITEYIKAFKNIIFVVAKLILIIIPTLFAVRLSLITESTINIIAIIITVVTALFFCLLTFLPDMNQRLVDDSKISSNEAEIYKELIKETYHIIMFEIFICIIV